MDEKARTDNASTEGIETYISEEYTRNSASPRMNPFSRFAFQASGVGGSPGSGTPHGEPFSSRHLGKRKADADSSPRRTRTGGTKIDSPSSSKKVKVYDHLREIDDHLETGLDIIFCGINPGEQSAQIGHHYGNPTNHFWSCLHGSGLTSRRLDPREDFMLPKQFSIGLTNLSSRPTVEQSELSKAEQVSGVSKLLDKVAQYQPRIVCFVGLGIADIVKLEAVPISDKGKGPKRKATIGLQSYKMLHSSPEGTSETLFFAVSSTSGRVVRYQKSDKVEQFKDLRKTLEQIKTRTLDTSDLISITRPFPIASSSAGSSKSTDMTQL